MLPISNDLLFQKHGHITRQWAKIYLQGTELHCIAPNNSNVWLKHLKKLFNLLLCNKNRLDECLYFIDPQKEIAIVYKIIVF